MESREKEKKKLYLMSRSTDQIPIGGQDEREKEREGERVCE